MGVKKILKAIVSPFVALAHALFGRRGMAALRAAYAAMAKTPLGRIVDAVVAEVQQTMAGETGVEKHKAAQLKIIAAAEALKLDWKESLVNTGIELALQALKHGW